jgi:hypothetical protein
VSRIEDDVLQIYDGGEFENAIVVTPEEDAELDDAENMVVVVMKSNGDGAVVTMRFDEEAVTGSLVTYADAESSAGRAVVRAPRQPNLDGGTDVL